MVEGIPAAGIAQNILVFGRNQLSPENVIGASRKLKNLSSAERQIRIFFKRLYLTLKAVVHPGDKRVAAPQKPVGQRFSQSAVFFIAVNGQLRAEVLKLRNDPFQFIGQLSVLDQNDLVRLKGLLSKAFDALAEVSRVFLFLDAH